ncbi:MULTISPECIES: antitoxin [unclassified Thiocapsa]|uniref:antitoxin n=1 Tax=unclassified Thiocapsa TaxID=2641286 RepID=UPI0035AE839B
MRIPAELRLDTDRVEITRTTNGDLILRPLHEGRGQALLEVLKGFDEDFVAAQDEDRAQRQLPQDREDRCDTCSTPTSRSISSRIARRASPSASMPCRPRICCACPS